MTATEMKNDHKQFKAGINFLLGRPCAVCGNHAEAVGSFTPDDPGALGGKPGDAVFFPICKKCLDFFDPDFFEATLKQCGVNCGNQIIKAGSSSRSA